MKKQHHYLKEWRKHLGLTQELLASRLDTTKGMISRVENFERGYTQETLEALALALGVAPADLLQPPPDPARPESEFEIVSRKVAENKEVKAMATRMLKALLSAA